MAVIISLVDHSFLNMARNARYQIAQGKSNPIFFPNEKEQRSSNDGEYPQNILIPRQELWVLSTFVTSWLKKALRSILTRSAFCGMALWEVTPSPKPPSPIIKPISKNGIVNSFAGERAGASLKNKRAVTSILSHSRKCQLDQSRGTKQVYFQPVFGIRHLSFCPVFWLLHIFFSWEVKKRTIFVE